MTPQRIAELLSTRADDLRLVVYHTCQGNERPIAARLFRLAFPPQDYACPLCGATPGPEGYLYEVLLDEDVPAEVPRLLEECHRGGVSPSFRPEISPPPPRTRHVYDPYTDCQGELDAPGLTPDELLPLEHPLVIHLDPDVAFVVLPGVGR